MSYWTAYLKANYPGEYMAGLLTSVGDDKRTRPRYLADCRKLGITVLPPDVNESELNFASVGADIRFGLGAIRNVGANVVSSLIATRTGKGKYTDFSDYLNKIDIAACNKKVTESLIKAGVRLAGPPAQGLFTVHPTRWTPCWAPRRPRRSGSSTCSAARRRRGTDAVFTIRVPDEEWDDKHKLALGARDAGPLRVRPSAQRGGPPARQPGGHPDPGHPQTGRCPTTPRYGSAASSSG